MSVMRLEIGTTIDVSLKLWYLCLTSEYATMMHRDSKWTRVAYTTMKQEN